jgi:hypothetical protein
MRAAWLSSYALACTPQRFQFSVFSVLALVPIVVRSVPRQVRTRCRSVVCSTVDRAQACSVADPFSTPQAGRLQGQPRGWLDDAKPARLDYSCPASRWTPGSQHVCGKAATPCRTTVVGHRVARSSIGQLRSPFPGGRRRHSAPCLLAGHLSH